MAVIQIVDDGSTIKLVIDSVAQSIQKTGIALQVDGDFLKIKTSTNAHAINWNDVTAPVVANAEALRVAVEAMIDTFPAGGGDATAANQVTQISYLKPSPNAAVTNVAASATVVNIKASNANRRSLTIVNDSNANLFLKYGSGASSTDYTIKLGNNDTVIIDDYNGLITGIWNVANGFAAVTEITV